MADLDVQTAQLIIQLARDDIYQLGDDAQNEGLLSDLEIALAAQEQEFMQRWMDYGDVQFHPGARARGGSMGDGLRNNNPFRPSISAPSSSNLATRSPASIHNRSNNGTSGGPSSSAQITNTIASIPLTRSPLPNHDGLRDAPPPMMMSIPLPRVVTSPKLVCHRVVEELSEDEDVSTSSESEPEAGPSTVVECYFCKEDCLTSRTIFTSCYHRLCQTCITRLIEVCIQDETTYPPKCCGNKLQINALHLRDHNLYQRYELKVREYDTPAPSRVYCYRCSRFLDSNSFTLTANYSRSSVPTCTTRYCNACSLRTCINCKRADHSGQPCQETAEDRVFRMLTKQKGWQTCPNCKAVVERTEGCNHMTCKCSMQFCYLCATRWKQCTC